VQTTILITYDFQNMEGTRFDLKLKKYKNQNKLFQLQILKNDCEMRVLATSYG
jgi:uncharacterized ubiquitin-like protein YukD